MGFNSGFKGLITLQNDPPSSTQMDGRCVKFVECTLFSMTVLVSCFLRQASRTLLQCIAKIRKGIRKSFAALPVDFPRLRTALTSRSSASRRVLLLPELFFCKYALFSILKWR